MGAIALVRTVGIVEGLSWLLLLFVAMPLKYGFDYPEAVRVVGMAHGVLFCVFCAVLLRAHLECRWSLKKSAGLFVAALLPFGFLFVDRGLRPVPASTSSA